MSDPTKLQIKLWKQQYSTPDDSFDWVTSTALPVYGHTRFTLDTCASPWNHKCAEFIAPDGTMPVDGMIGTNGLKTSWRTDGAAWCNPGFSEVLPWSKWARLEADKGQLSVALTHASHAAKWSQWTIRNGAAACWLINPRINFIEAPQYVQHLFSQGKKPGGNNRDSMLWVFDPKHRGLCEFIVADPWTQGGRKKKAA